MATSGGHLEREHRASMPADITQVRPDAARAAPARPGISRAVAVCAAGQERRGRAQGRHPRHLHPGHKRRLAGALTGHDESLQTRAPGPLGHRQSAGESRNSPPSDNSPNTA